MTNLPYLTDESFAVAGKIRTRNRDFLVEEIPLYEPSGEGDHVYFVLEKDGFSTMEAVRRVANAVGRNDRDFGYAGLKDAHAVTRQMVSLEHVEPSAIERLEVPGVRIVSVSRHRNKIRIGHLWGNRFAIKLREIGEGNDRPIRAVLSDLARRGTPNYFGPQRFGKRGDTWKIGKAIVNGDPKSALKVLLGSPGPLDRDDILAAREAYESEDFSRAAALWPHSFRDERRATRVLAKGGTLQRALAAVDGRLRRFYVSACQSWVFNRVTAARIGSLDRLFDGDLAWRHDNGAVFRVEDYLNEQPRADGFEISPTGPLFGRRMTEPSGKAGEIESAILREESLTPESLRASDRHKIKGGRRPLRFRPRNVEVDPGSDDFGPFVELKFELPAGCYATSLLREIQKSRLEQGTVLE
jgi:tRNA pseudouridine13 synthase